MMMMMMMMINKVVMMAMNSEFRWCHHVNQPANPTTSQRHAEMEFANYLAFGDYHISPRRPRFGGGIKMNEGYNDTEACF